MATTTNRNSDPNCIHSRGQPKKHRLKGGLDRLSHEFVNQLTVINLSCYRIRAVTPADSRPGVLAEVERIEKAVTEATELLASLPMKEGGSNEAGSQIAVATSTPSQVQGNNNVVPLFKKHHPQR